MNWEDILNSESVISEYKKIDKQNKYPFNHGSQHIKNVCEIMGKLCKTLNVNNEETEALLIACVLHDIGQVDGRDNHGLKAKDYIIKNYEGKLMFNKYYNDYLFLLILFVLQIKWISLAKDLKKIIKKNLDILYMKMLKVLILNVKMIALS